MLRWRDEPQVFSDVAWWWAGGSGVALACDGVVMCIVVRPGPHASLGAQRLPATAGCELSDVGSSSGRSAGEDV